MNKKSKVNSSGKGSVTIIDKFTGEIREGGIELLEQSHKEIMHEREMALKSWNPCYLAGKVKQNEIMFDVEEIKGMIDATFKCACYGSTDAWYPNQYALGIATEHPSFVASSVAYFLSNFELGLRISAERAARHLGKKDLIKESEHLAARLDDPRSMDELSDEDYISLKTYVSYHPSLKTAMKWYVQMSGGNTMRGAA